MSRVISPASLKTRTASSSNLNMVYVVATLALSTTLAVSALLFLLSVRNPDGAPNEFLRRVGRPMMSDCSDNGLNAPVTLSTQEYDAITPSGGVESSMSPKQELKEFTPDEINQLVTGDGKVYGESPPKAGVCTLLFNPIYRFIFVKNTKVAGTSLFLKFGGFCGEGITLEKAKENPNCLWTVTDILMNGLESLGYNSWEELWEAFQVITLVRNPYDRAGSSYDYTLNRRENRTGTCKDPTFQHYSSKPYIIGLQDSLYGCGDATHDFYHVEPQHTCLLDNDDKLVVDWVIRVKSLDEDLPIVLGALNNNRMEGAPELEDGIGWEQRGPIADERKSGGQEKAVTKVSRHKQKFEDCGSPCIHNLNQYYKKDFEVLQYPMDVE